MRLIPHVSDKLHSFILACIGVVVLCSIAAAAYAGVQADERIRDDLRKNSQIAAAALDVAKIKSLNGDETDEGSPAYIELKRLLANIKKADSKIRSIYLTGSRDDRLFFYVDSEVADSRDYSPAGEYYDDATPEFIHMFRSGETVVEGPVSDDFGTFISGLAPIFDPASSTVVAVLGIDVSSSTYWRDIAMASIIPLTTGLSLVLILMFFEWMRRRNAELMAVRSELVSVASHELRNPLTGIRWAAESLEPYAKDDTAKKLTQSIKKSAERLQISTDDILELSHAMNQRKLQIEDVDISALLVEIVGVQSLSAQQKNVSFKLDSSWPKHLIVKCDPVMMKRVLYNVISNAIKYTRPSTEITFASDEKDNMQSIHIKDNGIGIPKDEQTRVYKGFYRASNAVASDIPGTGLGLYLVKTVIEKHGGKVTFESAENEGTTITLSLPIHKK